MEETGGKPVFDPELNMYQIVFGKQHIDLWARNPILGEGQETVTIDGEPVVVLANAQILRGKLERAELHLVRDAYDIEKAATKDPEALQIAMNAMPRTTGEHVAHVWHWNGRCWPRRAHSRFPGHALTPTGVMAIRCKQFHLPDL